MKSTKVITTPSGSYVANRARGADDVAYTYTYSQTPHAKYMRARSAGGVEVKRKVKIRVLRAGRKAIGKPEEYVEQHAVICYEPRKFAHGSVGKARELAKAKEAYETARQDYQTAYYKFSRAAVGSFAEAKSLRELGEYYSLRQACRERYLSLGGKLLPTFGNQYFSKSC